MSQVIAARLNAIRNEMAQLKLDAFIQPRADEYLGEYVPAHNERLLWLTDFTGSAGMAIIMAERAAIFVDGRYTVQVQQQVDSELFQYESLTDMPQAQWLAENMTTGARIGYDPRLHTLAWQQHAQATLAKAGMSLIPLATNPIDIHWHDRPVSQSNPILIFDNKSAGLTSIEKRQAIGKNIAKAGADVALIAALDSICWLLNIRGQDIPRLPVVLGTALLSANGEMTFFTDLAKLPQDIDSHVGGGVTFCQEAELTTALSQLSGRKLLADPASCNAANQLLAQESGAQLIAGIDPVAIPKACKNEAELAGMRACHIRDGAAVTRFLAWLDAEVATGNLHDEATLADKLEFFRLQDPLYQEPSFDTISACGSNAAMCHYNHLNGTPATTPMDSLYLVDSGGQYLDGTTDVTRTIAIGNVSAEHKKMVTLVLKGHIALAKTRFPKGTSGQQLDTLARHALWQQGFDFDHGTGHGVGHFLSVHEGPQRIAKGSSDIPLLSGMVVSNEPGYYRANDFGIRLENLIAVQPSHELANAEREMFEFEPLTFIPMDKRLIEKELLTAEELAWFNQYHQQVFDALSPLLSGDDLAWLTQATSALYTQSN